MNLYEYKFKEADKDSFVMRLSVGSHELQMTFLWAIANQEQYDGIRQQLLYMADTDPLIDGPNILHNYNYVVYYSSLANMSDEELAEWLNADVPHPQSLRNMMESAPSLSTVVNVVKGRIAECAEIEGVLLHYKEVLRWQVSVSVDGDSPTVAALQPGGWYRRQEPVMFRFISDRESINRDELQYVTLQIGVEE